MNRSRSLLTCLALLALAGCSGPAPVKKAEKPPEPIGGLDALYNMYRPARNWAPDIEVLKVTSIHMPESGVQVTPGKAVAWQAVFVSPSRSKARSWTYSVVEGEGALHKGAFAGLEEGWSGPRGVTKPFDIRAVKIDTVDAYKTALAKAADYEKKNPGKVMTFVLESTNRFPTPTWRVMWGESAGSSNFSVMVSATLGDYLETMR